MEETIIDNNISPNCQSCDVEFTDDIWFAPNERLYCESCFEGDYSYCYNCNLPKPIDDVIDTNDGDSFCLDCRENNSELCFYCDGCSTYFSGCDSIYSNDSVYCENCHSDIFSSCESCGDDYENSDLSYCESNEADYCGDCWEIHDCEEEHDCDFSSTNLNTTLTPIVSPTLIHTNKVFDLPKEKPMDTGRPDYDLVPRPPELRFYKGKRTKFLGINRFVGVEIEVESGKFDEYMLQELPKGSVVKPDGSVKGFELNTAPASGDELTKIIKTSCSVLRKYGYQGTKRCGVHVHIDSRDFKDNPTKIANLARTYFAVEDLLFSLLPSSRWTSDYCKKINLKYLKYMKSDGQYFNDDELIKFWYENKNKVDFNEVENGQGRNDRYHGLNICPLFSPRGTVELRYHSGTTSSEKILNWIALNLKLFNYAIRHYNNEEIKELFDMETGQSKFEKFCKVFNLPKPLQEYMAKRAGLFNPDWAIKFNKGYIVREIEKQNIIHNKKIINVVQKQAVKKTYKELKAQYKIKYGKGWTKKVKSHSLKNIAQTNVNNMINYPKSRLNPQGSYGFMSREELQEKIKLMQRGMLMAVNKETGIKENDEFEQETGGLII